MSVYEMENNENPDIINAAAIVGMAGRFPKAKDIDEFRQRLENGEECISFYKESELIEAGIDPEALGQPGYVKAKGAVEDVDMFDASFFGINPREAELTDPQHRMLLECAWEALEHAGYDPGKYQGLTGIYAGKSMDYYLLLNVYPRMRRKIYAGSLQAAIGNDKDSLTTTIAYRLNLKGPAITIQTSSSTSLVSVCVACQSLLTYQCDMALAGGITAGPPIKSGYLHEEGGIWSPDGHSRAFDAEAGGFVPGSGMGMVVLKRLEDALVDRDTIWAVIKGYAVNNDGCEKVSYSAPSVDAQSRVVSQALAAADVHPETIQYIETHGTGTNLGDPIEMAALNRAFRLHTQKKHYCAVGSLKSNIGHLDNAAGVAGLIKTALALKYKKIPASLYFRTPNPAIEWEDSPFFVNTELREWPANTGPDGEPLPRRAGVTSLGMGGTNAHVILEDYPHTRGGAFRPPRGQGFSRSTTLGVKEEPSPVGGASMHTDLDVGARRAVPSGKVFGPTFFQKGGPPEAREYKLLLLSAKTATALQTKTAQLAGYIKDHQDEINLEDAAYTLAIGREDFNHRRAVLCRDLEEAGSLLGGLTPGRVFDAECDSIDRPVVFMFSGQGSQYVNMGKGLYLAEPVFRENIDKCAQILTPILGLDLRELIYPESEEDAAQNAEKLKQTDITQPVLFMIEYSLAQMWLAWGIKPAGMIGHSIGEYAAACTAGCISLEDALNVVAVRGRLMHKQERGTMLSVGLTESEIMDLLPEELSLAAVNSPKNCVVSGRKEAIEKLEKQLAEKEIFRKQLRTSHAFHSPMMEPIMAEFAAEVGKVKLNPPEIPFVSGVTGAWITAEEAVDPQYWAEQLRRAVRFSDGINEILTGPAPVLLEIGPGNSLCLLAKEHKSGEAGAAPVLFSSVRHIKQTETDTLFLLKTLGGLWLSGVSIDWQNYYQNEQPYRIPLPTYPFERKRYWLEEVKEKPAEEEIGIAGDEEAPAEEEKGQSAGAGESPAADGEGQTPGTFQPRPVLPNEYEAPTDDTERKVAAIWEDILGIKPIGIHDNFFDLGGHSLLATLFLSRLQEELGVRLELTSIFETPTVAVISESVKARAGGSDVEELENLLTEIEAPTPRPTRV